MAASQKTVSDVYRAYAEDIAAILLHDWGDSLVSVVLYGSVARGDAGPLSDVDLVIVREEVPRGAFDRRDMFREAIKEIEEFKYVAPGADYPPFITSVIKGRVEAEYHSPLYLDITEDGILLYEKDGFFEGILDEMRTRMAELGSKRVWLADGSWYWDLKPDYKFPEIFEI